MNLNKSIILLSFFVLTFSILFGYSYRDLDWMTAESEHFVYVYHAEASELLTVVSRIAEESYERLKVLFDSEPQDKIVLVLTTYEDFSNGYAESTGRIHVISLGNNYYMRFDEFWLRTVITHELSHVFHLGRVSKILKPIRITLSRFISPQALSPAWLIEGIAQLGSEYCGADTYGHRRLSFMLDQLESTDPFNNETIVSGYSPVGGEAYYNFGYAFVNYLIERYGMQKFRDFLKLRDGIEVLFGMDYAFEKVYDRTFEQLKTEFIESERERYREILKADFSNAECITTNDDFVSTEKAILKKGILYCLTYDRRTGISRIYKDNVKIFSTTKKVTDFTALDDFIVFTALERIGDAFESRLYFFEDGKLSFSGISKVLAVEILSRDLLVILRNAFGKLILSTLSLKNKRELKIYSAPDELVHISQLTANDGARFLAFRMNDAGKHYVGIYNFLQKKLELYEVNTDVALGSWDNDALLVTLSDETGSKIGNFAPENGKCRVIARFPRYCEYPLKNQNELLVVSQNNGRKLFKVEETNVIETLEFISTSPREQPKYGAFSLTAEEYSPFSNMRFLTLVPYGKGVGGIFEDYLSTSQVFVGVDLENGIEAPVFAFGLSSYNYSEMDLMADLTVSASDLCLSFSISRDYTFLSNLDVGWELDFGIPFYIMLNTNAMFADSIELFDGVSSLSSLINFSGKQTYDSNAVELSLGLDLSYRRERWVISSRNLSRLVLLGDATIFPVKFRDFYSENPLVFVGDLEIQYLNSRRNLSLFRNTLVFSREGYGFIVSTMVDSETFKWQISLYKFETLYPYLAFPLEIRLGVSLGSVGILPYFNCEVK